MCVLINLALILILIILYELNQFEALTCALCSSDCARGDQYHLREKCEGKNAACTILFDIRQELINAREITMKTNVTLKGCVNLTPTFQIRTAKKDHCHCKTGQSEHVSKLYVELLL